MRVLKDSIIYLFGEILSKVMPFLLLPYLSHKLGVSGFGRLSYYQTYLALFIIIFGLTQEGAVARYFYFYGKNGIDLILKSGYIYTSIVGFLTAIFCLIVDSEILFYGSISSIFLVFINVQLSVRQCQKQSWNYIKIQFLFSLLPALITVVMLETFSINLVEKRIISVMVANIITFLLAYWIYKKKNVIKRRYTKNQYKLGFLYFFSYGLPLLFHNLSIFIRGQLDKILIYHHFSDRDLGVYAMGSMLASILSVGILAINKALLPYYYELLKKDKISLKKIMTWVGYSFIMAPVPSIIAYLIPENIFLWILGDEFIGIKYYFILFLISTMLVVPYLMMVNYLFYYGKNTWISLCSVITTLIYLLALMLLLQTSIIYLPYASIIGALVILPILYVMTKRVVTTS